MTTLAYLFLAALIGFVLGRYQGAFFQNRGERNVSLALRKYFKDPDYHLLNHITLRYQDKTTQIDHILISRFGIFVIETKDHKGWIFANADHPTWTQVLFHSKFKFQNPIHQNHLHVKAVEQLLDFVPFNAIHSMIVFVGDAEFKTDMPAGVFTLPQLLDYLKSCTEEVMSLNRVQFCVGRLETARLQVSQLTDLEHLKSVQRRYDQKQ